MLREVKRSGMFGRTSFAVGRVLSSSVLAVAVTSAGCVPAPRGIEGYEHGIEQDDFFVPASFDLVAAPDYKRVVGLRSWTGIYRGRAGIADVEPAYISEMPRLGWELKDIRRGPEDTKVLVFHKGDEEARVDLARHYDSRFGSMATRITATIRPREIESYAGSGEEAQASVRRPGSGGLQPAVPPRAVASSSASTGPQSRDRRPGSSPRVGPGVKETTSHPATGPAEDTSPPEDVLPEEPLSDDLSADDLDAGGEQGLDEVDGK